MGRELKPSTTVWILNCFLGSVNWGGLSSRQKGTFVEWFTKPNFGTISEGTASYPFNHGTVNVSITVTTNLEKLSSRKNSQKLSQENFKRDFPEERK
ncbi:hypothetical protein [Thalassobius sp. I31.1]|uniref:hypothetical protein n=1 Tax=Thalassobius sp. I31.1 TaxID=2109912 RepID=UPI001300632B|nr:hypothetical protein [Thalassobius sp. I31.1]